MNIAIIDDRKKERTDLGAYLKDYADKNALDFSLQEFESAETFLSVFSPLSFTVIFMDIYMDGMTGIEASRKIRDMDSSVFIIFMTTSEEHRAEAFSVHAYEYIEKPLRKDRIFAVMDDLMRLNTGNINVPVLTFMSSREEIHLLYTDIVLIRTGNHNYLEITGKDGNVYQTRLTFSAISDILGQDERFLTINRGIIVGIGHIIDIRNATCLLEGGFRLPVNIRKEKEITETWSNYKFMQIRARMATNRKRNIQPKTGEEPGK